MCGTTHEKNNWRCQNTWRCFKNFKTATYIWSGVLSNIQITLIKLAIKSKFSIKRIRFEITSMVLDQNFTTRGSITTLLHPFWNRSNTGLGQFKYFIDAVLSWFEIKFIYFFGGKNNSFGNKSCRICHIILFVSHFPAIWSTTLNKPRNLIGCFVFSVASSLAGKKTRFKAKNGGIRE